MIYDIVLNTRDRSNLTAADNMGRSEYFFDWSVIPNSRYKMTFTFISTDVNMQTTNNIAIVSTNLGQTSCYTCSSTATSAKSSNIIGILSPYVVATNSYLYADKNINISIILNRPSSNNFRVDINLSDNITVFSDYAGAPIGGYILTLSLEEI